MRRIWLGAIALTLLVADDLAAQRGCRSVGRGRSRVTVCTGEHGGRRAGPVEFGVRGGYDFEEDGGMAGAQLRVPVIRQLAIVPSADVFFDNDDAAASEWQLNLDAVLRPDALAGLYLGAGVGFLNRDFVDDEAEDNETETGFNLLVGLDGGRIGSTSLRPFAEGRWTSVDDYDAFRLVAGFNVPISR